MSPLDKLFTVRIKAAPGIMNTSERLRKDLEQIRFVAAGFEKDEGDSRGSAVIEERYAKGLEEMEKIKDEGGEDVEVRIDERSEELVSLSREPLLPSLRELTVCDFPTDEEDPRPLLALPSLRLPHLLLLPSDFPFRRGVGTQVPDSFEEGGQGRCGQLEGAW